MDFGLPILDWGFQSKVQNRHRVDAAPRTPHVDAELRTPHSRRVQAQGAPRPPANTAQCASASASNPPTATIRWPPCCECYSLMNAWRLVFDALANGAPLKATGATMLDGLQVQRAVRPRPHDRFSSPIASINLSQRAKSSAGRVPDKFGEVTVPPTVLGVDCEAGETTVG